jgi:hypothetical protein
MFCWRVSVRCCGVIDHYFGTQGGSVAIMACNMVSDIYLTVVAITFIWGVIGWLGSLYTLLLIRRAKKDAIQGK